MAQKETLEPEDMDQDDSLSEEQNVEGDSPDGEVNGDALETSQTNDNDDSDDSDIAQDSQDESTSGVEISRLKNQLESIQGMVQQLVSKSQTPLNAQPQGTSSSRPKIKWDELDMAEAHEKAIEVASTKAVDTSMHYMQQLASHVMGEFQKVGWMLNALGTNNPQFRDVVKAVDMVTKQKGLDFESAKSLVEAQRLQRQNKKLKDQGKKQDKMNQKFAHQAKGQQRPNPRPPTRDVPPVVNDSDRNARYQLFLKTMKQQGLNVE
jgi:hypothetical protein